MEKKITSRLDSGLNIFSEYDIVISGNYGHRGWLCRAGRWTVSRPGSDDIIGSFTESETRPYNFICQNVDIPNKLLKDYQLELPYLQRLGKVTLTT